MNTPPLLVELLTEELPPKKLRALAEAFAKGLTKDLRQNNFLSTNSEYIFFVTPRRLAVRINDVFAEARSSEIVVKGPSVTAGLDAQGKPTPALLGFAKKHGVAAEALEKVHDGKQEVFAHRELSKGGLLRDCLGLKIQAALQDLPIPKLMSYQLDDGKTTVKFVRPAHRLVVLHGTDVVPCTALGLTADRVTEGHRFQGAKTITLAHAGEYEKKLEVEGAVIVSFDQRRAEIEKQLRAQAKKLGATLGAEKDAAPLLDEVTALVEWPAVYVGTFESGFLEMPQECLVLTMRTHQKYFPLFDGNGKLTNKFLIVSNMRLDDPQPIIEGNERVVRPRLADARFFYETDKKTKLADRVPQLANIVYHNKLGSQLARVQRIRKLATAFARMLDIQTNHVARAAELAKADLLTHMVSEFPELQGIMGKYYAHHDEEPNEVCNAIREHYQPRYAGDALPETTSGILVALAEKLEALTGMFGIGQTPTGDKDPYALRRHALGLIRILIEKKVQLSLDVLFRHAVNEFYGCPGFSDPTTALTIFLMERLRGYLLEKDYSPQEVEAVLTLKPEHIDQVISRLDAVRIFAGMPEAESLASANKRIGNILKKADAGANTIHLHLLKEPAEQALREAIEKIRPTVQKYLSEKNYADALKLLAQIKTPVDVFFNEVMVMVDDLALRENRVALLRNLHGLMNQVADISKLAPEISKVAA